MGGKPSTLNNNQNTCQTDIPAIKGKAHSAVEKILDGTSISKSDKQAITKNLNTAIKKISHQQQNKISIGDLKEKWYKSEEELAKLPDTVATNEKNYYIASDPSGNEKYKDILQQKYTTVINNDQNEETKKMYTKYQNLERQIAAYHSNLVSFDRLKQLNTDVDDKNKALKLDIDKYYKRTATSERKLFYEIQEIDNTKYYNTLIRVAYFVILGCYILFGGFFKSGHYKNLMALFFVFLYVVFPFVVKYIVDHSFDLYNNNFGK